MPGLIRGEARVTLPFSAQEIWPFVADTDRVNRAVGLPSVHYLYDPRPEGGEDVTGEYRIAGVLVARWHEYPFEWERPYRFSVLREYSIGIVERFFNQVELIPGDAGTTVRLLVEFTPRRRVYAPLLRFGITPVMVGRARRQYRAIGEFLAGRARDPFPDLARLRSPVDDDQLQGCLLRLEAAGAPERPTAELRRLLAEAADEDVAGMRPMAIAERWNADRRETLETFLRATVAGLLEMRWELLCPSCRGVKAEARHLQDLPISAYCGACNLPFAASVDEAIEARFYPAPAVREPRVGTYCVGSPTNTPHRLAQTTIRAGATHHWRLHLLPGPYLIRSPRSGDVTRLRVVESGASGAPERITVQVRRERIEPPAAEVAAGDTVIELENQTGVSAVVVLDDARWSRTAATPSTLMTFPAFRSLFSAEALAPGVELAIARVGLLFSDLAGSTELYERVGEARAFRLVSEHFSIMRDAVEAAGGSVVKTIGDAVMAAFPDGRAALAAALAAQRAIGELDTQGLADPARLIKIGVHSGPAYAVTLNERLDYFGTTVNIASRAQHEARGGEIVATKTALEESRALVEREGLRPEPFEVRPRGLSETIQLYRIRTARLPAAPASGVSPSPPLLDAGAKAAPKVREDHLDEYHASSS